LKLRRLFPDAVQSQKDSLARQNEFIEVPLEVGTEGSHRPASPIRLSAQDTHTRCLPQEFFNSKEHPKYLH